MPAVVMRALVGEMADELLITGQRVLPDRLMTAGFSFDFPAIEAALGAIEAR
jgi:NAD dependent epimerase/dehydratase family enzyme